MNIYDLISRAQKLRKETQLDSVSPDRVGGLHEDTLKYINEFQLLASSPSLHKIYASVSAMQSDKSPKSDLTGKPLKPGQLVVIVPANQTDATAGDVYRYDGPSGNTSAWTFVAKIGAVPADAELSATSTNPPQNKVVTEKLTELESNGVAVFFRSNIKPNYIALEDGYTIYIDSNRCYCDTFFSVSANTTIVLTNPQGYKTAIYFYNENKVLVSYLWYGDNYYVQVPSSATYVRFGFGVNVNEYEPIGFYTRDTERILFKPSAWIKDYKAPNINTKGDTISLEISKDASVFIGKKEVVFNDDLTLPIAIQGETTVRYLVFDSESEKLKFIGYTSYIPVKYYILGVALCDVTKFSGAWFDFEFTIDGEPSDKATREQLKVVEDNKGVYLHRYEDINNGYYAIENGKTSYGQNDGNSVTDSNYFKVAPNSVIKFTSEYLIAVWEFDKGLNFVKANWFSKKDEYKVSVNTFFVRVGYRKNEGLTKETFDLGTYFYFNLKEKAKYPALGRLSDRFEYHFFMGQNRSIIPPQSIYDLAIAKRLGFKSIELNVQVTSDNVLIAIHGSGGKFSYEVADLNGEYTYAETPINSVSYQWILDNIRYDSLVPKYRTKILTLEEIIREAKRIGIDVTLYMTSNAVFNECVRLLTKYQNIPSYGVYSMSSGIQLRALTNDVIAHYSYADTIEKIIEECDKIGSPYIHAMANEILVDSDGLKWSDEELSQIVEAVHSRGCYLACAAGYLPEHINQHLWKLGFDYAGSSWSVNDFECGNILNTGFDLYAVNPKDWNTDGVVDTYSLTLEDGNSIFLQKQEYMFLGKGYLKLIFNGEVKVKFGKNDVTLKSDGTDIIDLSSYFLDEEPTMEITSIGKTDIQMFNFKLSVA